LGAVAFDIVDVVQDIAGRRGHAEQREGGQGVGDCAGIGELAGKHQRRQNEGVLYPLPRAHELEQPDSRYRIRWR
jgi:hypothetical protein